VCEDGIVISKWKDKREILMSTYHGLEQEQIQTRTRNEASNRNDRANNSRTKPKVIIDYTTGKYSVDKSDQMASYASVNRRGVKRYKKVALELITGMVMVNAFTVFKEITKSNINITHFRRETCKSLLGIQTSSY